eukprot:6117356-Prymnesium_polylepis.1
MHVARVWDSHVRAVGRMHRICKAVVGRAESRVEAEARIARQAEASQFTERHTLRAGAGSHGGSEPDGRIP